MKWQDSDPLGKGMDPRIQIRIRIHIKIPWIRNTGSNPAKTTLHGSPGSSVLASKLFYNKSSVGSEIPPR
jgi:hypothetical protein